MHLHSIALWTKRQQTRNHSQTHFQASEMIDSRVWWKPFCKNYKNRKGTTGDEANLGYQALQYYIPFSSRLRLLTHSLSVWPFALSSEDFQKHMLDTTISDKLSRSTHKDLPHNTVYSKSKPSYHPWRNWKTEIQGRSSRDNLQTHLFLLEPTSQDKFFCVVKTKFSKEKSR